MTSVATDSEREKLLAEINKYKQTLGSESANPAARKARGKQVKDAILGSRKGRNGVNSETVISFRGSGDLKERLAIQKARCKGRQETLNEWIASVIEAALDAEERSGR